MAYGLYVLVNFCSELKIPCVSYHPFLHLYSWDEEVHENVSVRTWDPLPHPSSRSPLERYSPNFSTDLSYRSFLVPPHTSVVLTLLSVCFFNLILNLRKGSALWIHTSFGFQTLKNGPRTCSRFLKTNLKLSPKSYTSQFPPQFWSSVSRAGSTIGDSPNLRKSVISDNRWQNCCHRSRSDRKYGVTKILVP